MARNEATARPHRTLFLSAREPAGRASSSRTREFMPGTTSRPDETVKSYAPVHYTFIFIMSHKRLI
jgi:hypothetical protein